MSQHPHNLFREESSALIGPISGGLGQASVSAFRLARGSPDHANLAERIRLADQVIFDVFAGQKFVNLCWALLLELYLSDLKGQKLDISSLCRIGTVPISTALRRVNLLCEAGLIQREQDEQDGRRSFLILPSRTKEMVERCLRAFD